MGNNAANPTASATGKAQRTPKAERQPEELCKEVLKEVVVKVLFLRLWWPLLVDLRFQATSCLTLTIGMEGLARISAYLLKWSWLLTRRREEPNDEANDEAAKQKQLPEI